MCLNMILTVGINFECTIRSSFISLVIIINSTVKNQRDSFTSDINRRCLFPREFG